MAVYKLASSSITGRTNYGSMKAGFILPLTVDILVVAGGGGGGSSTGGGGGAGGYSEQSAKSLTLSTAYTVTVGAGGAGNNNPTAGSNSVFGSIISNGGGLGLSELLAHLIPLMRLLLLLMTQPTSQTQWFLSLALQ